MKSAVSRFLILGLGSWGSALACHLARQDQEVIIWGRKPQEVNVIEESRINASYLPEVIFPKSIQLTSDLAQAFQWAGSEPIIFIVVPSVAFAETVQKIVPYLPSKARLLWGTKGLAENADFFHVVCKEYCGTKEMAVLSGPSFAQEVGKGLPTAVTIATNNLLFGKHLVNAFHSETFRVYLSEDLIGVELGGTVKNVLAIAVGMSDGLGFGANARCALITRGLAELSRLCEKVGANANTIMGMSGIGDIVLTCTDNQSRNRRFGVALGKGYSQTQAHRDISQVIEGKLNVKQVMILTQKYNVEMPICEQVYQVLYNNLSPQQAVKNLLTRTPKSESLL